MKRTKFERIALIIIYSVLFIAAFITLYPFWHVLMYAISDSKKAMSGRFFILPKGFSLVAFQMLMKSVMIFRAYGNTLYRTIIGTFINIVLTATLAYPLSLRRFKGRNFFVMMVFFTMLFSGGLIPTFLVVKGLGLIDSRWALILPGAISAYNFIIMRNFFKSLPESLEESARIDGAGPARILFRIIIPVSKPVIAALVMFYSITHWNSYLDAVLYINSNDKQVLQIFLRSMLQGYSTQQLSGVEGYGDVAASLTEETVRMATIAISVIPMLLFYPFVQKYYIKGIMIGSIKG